MQTDELFILARRAFTINSPKPNEEGCQLDLLKKGSGEEGGAKTYIYIYSSSGEVASCTTWPRFKTQRGPSAN